jgi:hypothetical protein
LSIFSFQHRRVHYDGDLEPGIKTGRYYWADGYATLLTMFRQTGNDKNRCFGELRYPP